MKAAEYAERINNDVGELGKVAYDYLMEVKTICETRHVSTDLGLFGVLDEQANKWDAMCRLVTSAKLRSDGFAMLVHNKLPDVYTPWMMYREMMKQRTHLYKVLGGRT